MLIWNLFSVSCKKYHYSEIQRSVWRDGNIGGNVAICKLHNSSWTFKLVRYVSGMEDIKKLTTKHTTTFVIHTSWGSHPRKQITGNEGHYSLTVPVYECLTNTLPWLCFLHVFPSIRSGTFVIEIAILTPLKKTFVESISQVNLCLNWMQAYYENYEKFCQLDVSKKWFLKSHVYYSEKPVICQILPSFY